MAYHAILSFEGKEFDVVRSECRIERGVDGKGRPSSNLYGGRITIQVDHTDRIERRYHDLRTHGLPVQTQFGHHHV